MKLNATEAEMGDKDYWGLVRALRSTMTLNLKPPHDAILTRFLLDLVQGDVSIVYTGLQSDGFGSYEEASNK